MKVGDTVKVTSDNPGYDGFRDRVLVITHVATAYMPASEFFAQGRPQGFHPGFDEGTGEELYDFEDYETGEAIGCSLYDWEVEGVTP